MSTSRGRRLLSFFAELRRRRVIRVAIIYFAAAFAGLQGADVLAEALPLPAWTMRLLVVLVLAGFPVAVGLAWAFDIVPASHAGVEPAARSGDPAPAAPQTRPGPFSETPAPAAPATGPSHTSGEPLVAVVPFLNLSPDPDNEYFADGITEDVIAHLSKVRALTVISRTSVMPFKRRERSLPEIAATLGATALLDGSVRRAGDRVRIVAQLIDADTDRHLWAEM